MSSRHASLEDRIPQTGFKSAGERRIAAVLDRYGIRYAYEQATAVTHRGKTRIWYPDFHLPEFALYIEYYGLAGDPAYDHGVEEKTRGYSATGLEVIPVYPHHINHTLAQYLTGAITDVAHRRFHLARTHLQPTAVLNARAFAS